MNGHGIERAVGVALAKEYGMGGLVIHYPDVPSRSGQVYPWYPIVGHREGLRMNDLVTLASAFSILANEGGTAHVSEIPGTTRSDGSVVPFRN